MVEVLVRIKRAVLSGRYAFSEKARIEMEVDGLTDLDVAEDHFYFLISSKRTL